MPERAEGYIKVGDLTVHYWVAGGGPPVVLIHGLGASVGWWRPNIGSLARAHRVFVPELPGHGLSDKPRGGYDLALGVRCISGFMAAFGLEKAAVVGQSLGGLIALEMALHFPHKVTHLVLVDSAGLGRELCRLFRWLTVPFLGELMVAPTQFSLRVLTRMLFSDPRSIPEGFLDEICRERQRPGAKRAVLAILRAGANLRGLRSSVVALERLARIKAPALVVWGADDRVVPVAHAHAAHRLIPGSRLHVIPNCGHCPQLEKPVEFNEVVLRFLGDGMHNLSSIRFDERHCQSAKL